MNGIDSTSATNGLHIPKQRPFLICQEHKALLAIVQRLSVRGRNSNVLIHGLAGCGKSEMATQFAATNNRPLAVLEVGRLSESSQIFGYMDLQNGQTCYVKGLFTEAITTPGCVVHLQELNRPESDKALNAIFSVLDDGFRSVWLDELHGYVQVAPGVTFFATLNEGFEFIGTMPLDAALEDRFPFKITLGYLPPHCEKNLLLMRGLLDVHQASELLEMIGQLRNNGQTPVHVSTRDTMFMAELMGEGLSTFLAIKTVLGTDNDKLESILLTEHLQGHEVAGIGTTEGFELL